MQFSAVLETLKRTTFGKNRKGKRVNLERALLVGGRVDGHYVLGHVDGIGTIKQDRELNGSTLRTITVPKELSHFFSEKGSVAIDGISLTIADTTPTDITISFIPHTLSVTTMSLKRPGNTVNLECDMIARYLAHLLHTMPHHQSEATSSQSLVSLMERSGF
jgi:riboflavin synthase